MHLIVYIVVGTFAAAIPLLVLFVLLHFTYFRDLRRTVLSAHFALYLCAVFEAVGFPSVKDFHLDWTLNLVPFVGLVDDLPNALLNVLLFLPLGLLLPLIWERFQKARYTLLYGLSLSACIELMQLFTYRTTDVDDLLTNLAGTCLGWLIAKGLLRLRPLKVQGDRPKKRCGSAAWPPL